MKTKTNKPTTQDLTKTAGKLAKIAPNVSFDDALAAFEASRKDREALAIKDLLPINLDPGAGALIAVGALPRIEMYGDLIKAAAPECARAFEQLSCHACAAFHANYLWLNSRASENFAKQYEQLQGWRTKLFAVLSLAIVFGIIEQAVLDKLKEGQGYRDSLEDVGAAESIVRSHWSELEGKCPLKAADLDTIRGVAYRFAVTLAEREAKTADLGPTADDRIRAFTLLAKTYSQIRRALTFKRWDEGDVDEIAPSLWIKTGGGRKYGSDEDKPAAPVVTSAPVANPVTAAPENTPSTEEGPKGNPFTT